MSYRIAASTTGLRRAGATPQRSVPSGKRAQRLRLLLLGAVSLLGAACGAAPDPAPAPAGSAPVVIPYEPVGSISTPIAFKDYARLSEDAPAGRTVLHLDRDLKLRPNDLILLYEARGAQIETQNTFSYGLVSANNGAGSLEIIGVVSVGEANAVTVYDWCGGLQRFRSKETTQVIRIPQYQFLDVTSTGSLQAMRWDGKLGGVLALSVAHDVIVDGRLTATESGFRGGVNETVGMPAARLGSDLYRSRNPIEGGAKGEGIAGDGKIYAALGGSYGRGAPANGGGGGNALFAGGGGGGNGGESLTRSGNGVMVESAKNPLAAWQRDPAFIANRNQLTEESGGGRGGYTYSEAAGDPLRLDPGSSMWRGDSRRAQGGLGGASLINDPGKNLYFGGGGGAGDNSRSSGGRGGDGGGLILVFAHGVYGNGSIDADGQPGFDAALDGGGGGGGAGGSIVIAASEMDVRNVSARGGAGGKLTGTGPATGGPGGGGGGGYVLAPDARTDDPSVDGGSAGTTGSGTMASFEQNGATAGHQGFNDYRLTSGRFSGIPACTTSDLGVTLSVDKPVTSARDEVVWTAALTDQGPTAANRVELSLQLPETSVVTGVVAAAQWTCVTEGARVLCTRRELPLGVPDLIKVTALPPLSVRSALATATVRSGSLDPASDNNISQCEIQNSSPRMGHAFGSGLSCAMSGRSRSDGGARGLLPLLLCIALLHFCRPTRTARKG